MQADDWVYAGQMLDVARKARGLVAGRSRADFDADEVLRLALIHLIQLIGEAARRVSAGFQAEHPEVPWTLIVGMRHKVVHDYLGVDEDVVWETLQQDLPQLIGQPESLQPPAGTSSP